ncbi:MAG: hypothetical protein Q9220_004612 [cf. Caloplaca sp. 1 TL-2023]
MVGLRLDFTPSQPSQLRHCYAPRSPASPLESLAKRPRYSLSVSSSESASESDSSSGAASGNPPPSPYKWMWYCHECRTGYQLGVTRRCLIDDHQLCYGSPVKKSSKKRNKKTRACHSSFDYLGWQKWGEWKRSQTGQDLEGQESLQHNCSLFCDWPSQCRRSITQEQPVEEAATDLVQEVFEEVALETPEPATSLVEESAEQEPRSVDGFISKIGTATQKLTSQWGSLLSPVEEAEEEETSLAAIEDFLRLANSGNNPTTSTEVDNVHCHDHSAPDAVQMSAPLNAEQTSSSPPSPAVGEQRRRSLPAHTASIAFGLGFDFGFHCRAEGEDNLPSVTDGLHQMAASAVGIALSTPSIPRKGGKSTGTSEGQRAVSEPGPTPIKGERRRSQRILARSV